MAEHKRADTIQGRYAYDGLDRVMHEKARLGILTSLMAHPHGLLFTELKSLCGLTDGNLSRHLQVLQEAGLVEFDRQNQGRRLQSLYRLSRLGHERFLVYLSVLERIVRDASDAEIDIHNDDAGLAGSKWASA